MICLVALPIFLILGIFSVKYRKLAKESLDCIFKRIVFKPCRSGLDKRIKGKITGKLINKHPGFASVVYKHFELISWVILVLMIVSLYYSAEGAYNYAKYGNCNGAHSEDFCIFNPLSNNISCGSEHCAKDGCYCGEKETNCTKENNYLACEGNCSCDKLVCG